MALDNAAIIDRIDAIMTATLTSFSGVIPGLPRGLPPGDRWACHRYLGREEVGFANLTGQREVYARFEISLFWLPRAERATLLAFEKEKADAEQALKTAFRADATLTGTPSGPPYRSSPVLEITDGEVDPGSFPRSPDTSYDRLNFELRVLDREAEGTTI